MGPGPTVRSKPRTLSTPQTISSCRPSLEVKQQVKALALPASGKEDRAARGQILCSKGRGRAVCWCMLAPTGPGKLLPTENDPDPTSLGQWGWLSTAHPCPAGALLCQPVDQSHQRKEKLEG